MSETETLTRPHESEVFTEPRLVLALLSISKMTRALFGIRLAEYGFHNGQDELLIALDEAASVSVSQVADVLAVRPSTVSKMLDRLIEKGLVERVNHATDARKTMVRITFMGLDMRSKLLGMREQIEGELMAALSDNAENTMQSLEHVSVILKQRLSRLR